MTKEMISIFPTFPFICSNIPAAPAYGVYDIPELVVPIRISLTEGCC
jgi:hypothetical protein